MSSSDLQRRVAFAELLAQPDPPEMDRLRGNHLRVPGKPNRYAMLADLAAAFVQRHLVRRGERENVVWGA